MPDYAAMYRKLFNSQTTAINILQEAQKETENIYIESEPPDIRVLHTEKDTAASDEDGEKE